MLIGAGLALCQVLAPRAQTHEGRPTALPLTPRLTLVGHVSLSLRLSSAQGVTILLESSLRHMGRRHSPAPGKVFVANAPQAYHHSCLVCGAVHPSVCRGSGWACSASGCVAACEEGTDGKADCGYCYVQRLGSPCPYMLTHTGAGYGDILSGCRSRITPAGRDQGSNEPPALRDLISMASEVSGQG